MLDILFVFQNRILIATMLSWIIAQSIKVALSFIMYRKLDITRVFGAGGMPSAHSASVMCLSVSCGLYEGWDSPIFAVSIALAMVVMYDAAGVRRAAGKQAAALNRLIDHISAQGARGITTGQLKELLGHSPFEVLVGAALGAAIGLAGYLNR